MASKVRSKESKPQVPDKKNRRSKDEELERFGEPEEESEGR